MNKLALFLAQVLVLIPVFSLHGNGAGGQGSVRIIIEPVFNGEPLRLNERIYVSQHGDTLSVDLFKFYMTRIAFVGDSKSPGACKFCSHLVDAEDSATCAFSIAFPEGIYTELSFVLGVDSIANTSGANDGDLDPAKGMFWAWNTGYIMAKLEGRSKVCKTVHNAYEFHIGGYTPPNNTARDITLRLPQSIVIKQGQQAIVVVKADVAAWFSGVDLSKLNSVVIPGKEAMATADRYSKMFSVK